MRFFKTLFASFLGTFLALALLFAGFFIVISIISATATTTKSTTTGNLLEIHLENQKIKDYAPQDPLQVSLGINNQVLSIHQITQAISHAATNPKIKGISIINTTFNGGITQTKAFRDALADFKKTGKFIYAYQNNYTQKQYYLNSIADTLAVHPLGNVAIKGLTREVLFFKAIQEKTGVKIDVIRHGKYKSAVEPFLQDTMSVANREQIKGYLSSIWKNISVEIAKSRDISEQELNDIALHLKAHTPEMAKQQNIIDLVIYQDQYQALLQKKLGVSTEKKIKPIALEDYIANPKHKFKTNYKADKIAVIYAQGDIKDSKGDENTIGPDIINNTLKKAREDDKIKAIVLRINSPGGSALASDIMWREIERTKAIKPVVVSMGDMAASGGYYIACNANYIVAQPNTITGSIGVFGVIPNVKGLSDKLGVNAQRVSTHNNGGVYNTFSKDNDAFKKRMQQDVEHIYTAFLKRVAQGRNMAIAQVDSIAQGRVWTGTDALQNNLVDKIGNLQTALDKAAELADIEQYRVVNYPKFEKDFDDILKNLTAKTPFGKTTESILKQTLGPQTYHIYKNLQEAQQKQGIQARLPYYLYF